MFDVFYNSRSRKCKQPFGAVPVNQEVTFRIRVYGDKPKEVVFRLWYKEEKLYPMTLVTQTGNNYEYEVTIVTPQEPILLWYLFFIKSDNHTFCYANNYKNSGGVGQLFSNWIGIPPAFQLTVYEKNPTPSWLKQGIMYQIFPDRFYRSEKYNPPLKKSGLLHMRWSNPAMYARDGKTGEILAYDFFGGNIQGIIEKLDYLEKLDVKLIYLNPIFESVSNHRYDTGDYEKIDEILGTKEDFQQLTAELDKRGMHIIIDGVFSHTGSDSKYFNKEKSYKSLGAWQGKNSPYYNWYKFDQNSTNSYASWWGIGNLPNVNELEPSYLDYIIESENSIINQWHQSGISGWRLDVADELPLEFLQKFYSRLKKLNPDNFLLGEVWEDASNKIAYGEQRCYFNGYLLDSVMNYPFRTAVLAFLKHEKTAGTVNDDLHALYENYPPENFSLLMNLIGSHDTKRALTEFACIDNGNFTDVQNRNFKLDDSSRKLSTIRLKQAVTWQFTFPGIPCIYYGDEAGLEGFKDPYNRGTYPWGSEDLDILSWHLKMVNIRKRYQIFQNGFWKPCHINDDIIAYKRFNEHEEALIVINRAPYEMDIMLPSKKTLTDIISGVTVNTGKQFTIDKVAVFVEKPIFPDRKRAAGVLLHPTSLNSICACGSLGKSAINFIDFLSKSGHTIWQILPLTPTDMHGSPYAGNSAFAGNTDLIDLELFVEQNLLTKEELAEHLVLTSTASKNTLYRLAFNRFIADENYQQFVLENEYWLNDYILFMALSKEFAHQEWQKWPVEIVKREPSALKEWTERLASEINYQKFIQYKYFEQWRTIKTYAEEKGITIIGDIPIYVALNSVEVWVHPELFELDENHYPLKVAGVPPDYFSPTGQRWGNPLYDWRAMELENYAWWIKRLEFSLKNFDVLRIDHFRALSAYWAIPNHCPTAIEGTWETGPGQKFFRALEKAFGKLPFILEDLGVIDSDVDMLRRETALPGMEILQFTMPTDDTKILYSGTHDNDTLVGFCINQKDSPHLKYLHSILDLKKDCTPKQLASAILDYIYKSGAIWTIVPLQDLLELDSSARFNTPGFTSTNNWHWQMPENCLDTKLITKANNLVLRGKRR